ncbi:MAG: hypothetical protein CSA79_01830 [Thiothrix nivea]|nr:MAG: hypothetical protein CSA79_01830 [Thiothrix nivea]
MSKMNYLKKTALVLTLSLASALATMPVVANESATATNTAAISRTLAEQVFIGSWIVTIDDGYKSPYLFSFLPGGVITQSENPLLDSLRSNLAFSTAHGAWAQNADGSFTIRYFKQAYDAGGLYAGLEETNGILRLDDDNNLTGKLTVGKIRQKGNEANEISQSNILFSGTKIRVP